MRWMRLGVLVGLAIFYVAGATRHAEKVNTFKARGDQSGYLGDAEDVYWNWHGRTPAKLIGERNRMPLYAGYLALWYSPTMSDDQFFLVAKRANIFLSLGLLAILAAILPRFLPEPAATNLLLIAAFGFFIFKAGYAQSELLFYFLFFVAFLCAVQILRMRPEPPRIYIWAILAGDLAALAHLTKAAMLPFVAVVFTACVLDAGLRWTRDRRAAIGRLAGAAIMLGVFLATLSPYLLTSKRVFGQYFYNVNTTFYVWYNNWPEASVGTYVHGDGIGWPTMPPEQLPGASRYWHEHSVAQMAARVGHGLADMVERSYRTYRYFSYVCLYLATAALLVIARRRDVVTMIRRNPALTAFVAMYALIYTLGIAFYEPISGTGTTRFLIAHLLPLLFVLSLLFAKLGVRYFNYAVSALLAFDIVFIIWPRLMTTYGGF